MVVLKEGWRRRSSSPKTTSHPWLPATLPGSAGLQQAPKAGPGALPTLQRTPLERDGSQEARGRRTRQRHVNLTARPPEKPQRELCRAPSADRPAAGIGAQQADAAGQTRSICSPPRDEVGGSQLPSGRNRRLRSPASPSGCGALGCPRAETLCSQER